MNESISLLIAIPFFLGLMLVEFFYQYKKNKHWFRLNDTITNLNIGIGSIIFGLLIRSAEFGAYAWVLKHFTLIHMKSNLLTFFFVLLLYDFCFYWAHRFGHEMNFFWGAHVVHHQSEEYNLSVALRQSWIHNLLAFVFFLPIAFFGIDIAFLGIVISINTFYQFWIHTKAIKKLPNWFEFIFNSPSHHRVHHAVNPKYLDKNHAGMFIIWDRIFGTFKEEEEEPVYGVTTPFESWNPLWSNIDYYFSMFKISKKFNRFTDKIIYLFSKPGWLPKELGGFQPITSIQKNMEHKFDSKPLANLNFYVLFQFVFILFASIGFLYFYNQLLLPYKIWGFIMILLSTVLCGAIMEQKKWVKIAEYIRIVAAVVGLNLLYHHSFFNWYYIMLICSIMLSTYFLAWFTLNVYFNFSFTKYVRNQFSSI